MKVVPLFLLAFLLAVEAGAQDRNASVIGVVSDSVSHQPLRNVTVTLEVNSTVPQPPEARVVTDDAGAFAFHDLKPGQYRAVVYRPDYPALKTITVSASENPDPVHIELVPGAIVSGRILDEDGDPLNGCWVQAHPVGHPEQIASSQNYRGTSAPSDYRVFGLRPGKYILAAQCGAPVFQPRPFSAGPDPPPSLAYPRQFYPAAPDAASAEPVELAAGIDRAGIDFRMQPAHVTEVRAVIAPSSAGWHGTEMFGGLIRPGDLPGNQLDFGRMSPDSSGAFRFPRIFPGSYVLVVTSLSPKNRIGGIQPIEVTDQPVNAEIELKRAVDIHGTVELESGSHSAKVQLSQIRMTLLSDYSQITTPEQADVKQDGSFTLNSLLPIPWRIYVNGSSVFVKSVWLGSKEASGHVLDLSNGSPDTVKIVLSANTATIRGTAPPETTVAYRNLDEKLIVGPPQSVDQSGQFRIEGLAPGRYRVAAGESYDAIPESGGREITVQEGETATVDLPPA